MQDKNLEKQAFSKSKVMLKISATGPFYDQVWNFTKVKPKEKVLDIGCGTGVYGIRMARQGGDVTGIDLSSQAIKFVNRWAKKENVSFKGIVGDAEKLPFKNGVFDLVFCGSILHHFPDCFTALKEAKRVLKKNGRIVIIEPNGFNPVLRFFRFFGKFLPENLARDIEATKNETLHTPTTYIKILKQLGFSDFKKLFLKNPPTHRKIVTKNLFLKTAIILKKMMITIIGHLVPIFGSERILLSAGLF